MGWKERAEAYGSGKSERKEQKFDDFIARKILKAFGCAEKKVWDLCGSLGIEPDPDAPMLDTAMEVLRESSSGFFDRQYSHWSAMARPLPQKKLIWPDEELAELAGMARSKNCLVMCGGVLVMTKMPSSDGDRALGFAFVHHGGYKEKIPDWVLKPRTMVFYSDKGVTGFRRDLVELLKDMAESMNWWKGEQYA